MVSTNTLAYIFAFLIILSFGIYGTYTLGQTGNFNIHTMSFTDAVYFTVATISTVGYGDIYPVTPAAQIFVVVLIIAGVTTFLATLVYVAGEFINQRVAMFTGRISSLSKRLLNKHTVLIGANSTNLYIAERLKENNENFIIVTSDKTMADRLRVSGYRCFLADATLESDMSQFNLDKASRIVIDMRESSRVVYALMVVKEMSKNAKIIVISPRKETERHLRELGGERAIVINPSEIAAKAVNETVFKHR